MKLDLNDGDFRRTDVQDVYRALRFVSRYLSTAKAFAPVQVQGEIAFHIGCHLEHITVNLDHLHVCFENLMARESD